MTDSAYFLRIGDAWLELPELQADMDIPTSRASSSTESVGGVVRSQRARRSSRMWPLRFTQESASVVRWLTLAAQGLVGDVYLYDVAAAQVNMLNPLDTIGADALQPTILVDAVPVRTFAAGYTLTMSLRAGVAYHLSGTTSRTAAATLGTYNLGAGAVNIVAPVGTGARRWSTSFTPSTAVTVTVIVTVAGVTSALRLTEGSVDSIGFLPGMKAVCQVSVSDPQQTLSTVFEDRLPLSDYAVVLREVG